MTHSGTDTYFSQLRAALEDFGDSVWQHADGALLPKPIMQYLWTNFPNKISEANLLLASITPGEEQTDAIRQLSQRGERDVLPTLAYIESCADFPDEARQAARTAQQRITAYLERKARKHVKGPAPLEDILDNYVGYVCAQIACTIADGATSIINVPDTGVRETLVVWFQPEQPEGIDYGPVSIQNGHDRDEVLFDVLLDSDDAVIEPQRCSVTCRAGAASAKMQFSATGEAHRQRVYWVNVFQRNRLIQILEIAAADTEMENRDESEGGGSLN